MTGYVWAYASSVFNDEKIIYFDCTSGRSSEYPIKILESFSGMIMVDGYAGYETVINRYQHITAAGCLTHVRRKFTDIIKSGVACTDATYFIQEVGKLYHYENEAKNMSHAERLALRQKESAPIIATLGE